MAVMETAVDEIAARRAVAGTDADMVEAGLTPEQADAMTAALRFYLKGEIAEARQVLEGVFKSCTVDRVLAEFAQASAKTAAAA